MKTTFNPILLFGGGIVATLAILAVFGVFTPSSESEIEPTQVSSAIQEPNDAEESVEYEPASFSSNTNQITCTYPQILSANYFGGRVNHELPPREANPLIFTFTDFNGDVATLRYIDATRTISETQLYKLSESSDKLVFLEGDGSSYLSTHTIFKNAGVSLYSKQVDLIGTPSGSLAMGTCVGI